MVLSRGFLGRLLHILGENRAVGLGDPSFINLIWDDLFDEIFQPQRDFGDLLGRD